MALHAGPSGDAANPADAAAPAAAAEAGPSSSAAPAASTPALEFAALIAGWPEEAREDALATAEASLIARLPPAIRAEAEAVRRRHGVPEGATLGAVHGADAGAARRGTQITPDLDIGLSCSYPCFMAKMSPFNCEYPRGLATVRTTS